MKLFVLLLIFGFVSISVGQSKSINEKLKSLKDVAKITIESSESTVSFEGKEARQLMKRLKTGNKFIVKTFSVGDDSLLFVGENSSDIEMNVTIDDEAGNKVVKIVKIVDGKKEVEEYRGEEAEEFLSNNSINKKFNVMVMPDDSVHVLVKFDDDDFSWISSDGDSGSVEKNINVEVNDGEKKITVTTVKDGEKTVKVYEGKEAEEFLKNEGKGKNIKVFISDGDGAKKIEKKLIIIKEEKEDAD